MSFMFYDCSSLDTIPSLNISNITKINGIFFNCSSLLKIRQVYFFYQTDKLLLKSLKSNPIFFTEQRLNKLLEKYT
jgi:hypothetical protein